jgi:hypothetical protein
MDCEIPAIELLLRYKAIPDVTDRNLRTPLQTLVENADTKTCDFKTAIRFLLSAGAKIDRAFQGRTALEMALGLGNYSAARALLRFGAHLPLGSSLLNEANILASEIRVSQRAKEEARQSNHAIVLESVQDVLQFGRGSQRVERALYQALLKPNSMALEDFFSNGIASNEWVELIEFQLRMAHFIAMRVDWQWSDDYHTQEWNEKHTLFKMSFLSQNERWIHVLTVLERYLSVRFPLSQRNFLTKENWQALSEISNIIAEFLDDLGYWNLDQATSVSLLKESTKRLFSLFSLVEGKKESSRNQRAYTELIRHLNSRFSPIPTK